MSNAGCGLKILFGLLIHFLYMDESTAVKVLFTTDHYHPLCKKRSTDLNIFNT